jgi:adenosylcobinamide-phosphate synthase
MIKPTTLAGCFILDLLCGDPEWFPHPVRVIGKAVEELEEPVRRLVRGPREELFAGAWVTAVITGGAFVAAYVSLQFARRKSRNFGRAIEILLGWTTLAVRNLLDEAEAVILAVESGKLVLARKRLARIVGRDTESLDEREIARAVIETVAESTCDGVIAPMFYLVIGGAPLALAFKAVSTLDSMIGHRNERYLYFGRAAARADDIMNYLPARISAAAIALAANVVRGTDSRRALAIWKRDGVKHLSPNAGQCEAAMAGALQVRLGGANSYDGELHRIPHFGSEFEAPTARHARRSLKLAFGASLIALAFGCAFSLWRGREH